MGLKERGGSTTSRARFSGESDIGLTSEGFDPTMGLAGRKLTFESYAGSAFWGGDCCLDMSVSQAFKRLSLRGYDKKREE